MDIQQTLHDAIELAGQEMLVIEASEKARSEAFANGRYDLFDETVEDMLRNYNDFASRILKLLQTGHDPGPSQQSPITCYDGHRPVRE